MTNDVKICATCGREMTRRKRWEGSWDEVRHCSKACRRTSASEKERLETALLTLLDARDANASICPSEVARRHSPDDWKPWMEKVRQAARRLAHAGTIEITQGGKVVDPANFRGAIRLRRRR